MWITDESFQDLSLLKSTCALDRKRALDPAQSVLADAERRTRAYLNPQIDAHLVGESCLSSGQAATKMEVEEEEEEKGKTDGVVKDRAPIQVQEQATQTDINHVCSNDCKVITVTRSNTSGSGSGSSCIKDISSHVNETNRSGGIESVEALLEATPTHPFTKPDYWPEQELSVAVPNEGITVEESTKKSAVVGELTPSSDW